MRSDEPQPHEQRNMRAWREQLTSIRTATEFNLHGEEEGRGDAIRPGRAVGPPKKSKKKKKRKNRPLLRFQKKSQNNKKKPARTHRVASVAHARRRLRRRRRRRPLSLFCISRGFLFRCESTVFSFVSTMIACVSLHLWERQRERDGEMERRRTCVAVFARDPPSQSSATSPSKPLLLRSPTPSRPWRPRRR